MCDFPARQLCEYVAKAVADADDTDLAKLAYTLGLIKAMEELADYHNYLTGCTCCDEAMAALDLKQPMRWEGNKQWPVGPCVFCHSNDDWLHCEICSVVICGCTRDICDSCARGLRKPVTQARTQPTLDQLEGR